MPQEYIEIRGARENNLKNVSLQSGCHSLRIDNDSIFSSLWWRLERYVK